MAFLPSVHLACSPGSICSALWFKQCHGVYSQKHSQIPQKGSKKKHRDELSNLEPRAGKKT